MALDDKGYEIYWIPEEKRCRRKHHKVLEENRIPYPSDKVIHHSDFNKLNNQLSNFEFLTRSEHALLHHEERALKECGNKDFRKCYICQKYDDPQYLYKEKCGGFAHRECRAKYLREWTNNRRKGE